MRKVSIVINYKDVQTLAIKAYHTITMDVQALDIVNGSSKATQLITITENYNHGVASEEEAKAGITKKVLMQMFYYTKFLEVCFQTLFHNLKNKML